MLAKLGLGRLTAAMNCRREGLLICLDDMKIQRFDGRIHRSMRDTEGRFGGKNVAPWRADLNGESGFGRADITVWTSPTAYSKA